jgi:hypothetical protein
MNIRLIDDLTTCEELWDVHFPQHYITDLWPYRLAFHSEFKNPLHFLVIEDGSEMVGFFPLSLVEETQTLVCFPGELWQGRTWIEQNRVFAEHPAVFSAVRDYARSKSFHVDIRYVLNDNSSLNEFDVDEINFLFCPHQYDYNLDRYYQAWSSRRSLKSILKDIKAFEERAMRIVENRWSDWDSLVAMNVSRFGADSYFADQRFVRGMRMVIDWLKDSGWLTMTTVEIDGRIAAVDAGSVMNNIYTVFAGGVDSDFPGIAKVINMFHLRRTCEQRYDHVDFLCGDFHWKRIFHLSQRPLYKFTQLSN